MKYYTVYVCVSSTLQECLEKCGESLQEIVNYHMVRHTSALATGERSRQGGVPTRPGPLGMLMCFRHPVPPGSSIAQHTSTQFNCDLTL